MQGKRTHRVGQAIQMELSQLILTKVKDPRLGFVTLTHVDVSPDLKSARVFYTVMGDAKAKGDTQKVLERASGFLQRSVASVLNIKYTPKLLFKYDDSLDQGIEVDRVLRDLKKNENF